MNPAFRNQSSPSLHGSGIQRGAVIIFWLLLIIGIATGYWVLRPHWKAIYSSSEVTVKYREGGPYLMMHVTAQTGIYPNFRFDYWQDGLRHKTNMLRPSESKVEPIYGVLENGAICARYGIFDLSAEKNGSTVCGALVSSATVTDLTRDATHWSYTIVLPKQELSSSEESASMVIDFWTEATQSTSSYPPERFMGPAHIQYSRGLFDFRWLPH